MATYCVGGSTSNLRPRILEILGLKIPIIPLFTFNSTIDDIDRVSFYSRLPASHDKNAGFLTKIFCDVAIHFIPNIACVML